MHKVRSISKCNNLQLEISHRQKKIVCRKNQILKRPALFSKYEVLFEKRDNHVGDTMSAKLHQEENIQGKCQI